MCSSFQAFLLPHSLTAGIWFAPELYLSVVDAVAVKASSYLSCVVSLAAL